MQNSAAKIVRRLRSKENLITFSNHLKNWLIAHDVDDPESQKSGITNTRAKAVMRAMDVIDDPVLNDFIQLLSLETAIRCALYDLLDDTKLGEEEGVIALSSMPAEEGLTSIPWYALIVSANAWKSNYPVVNLDPTHPPQSYSPAGQLLKRSGQFIRKQVQRSPTERDKLAMSLSIPLDEAATLDQLDASGEHIAPLPPHYRTPIPVRYPEMTRDTLQLANEDIEQVQEVTRGDPLVITEEEVGPNPTQAETPERQAPIRITRDQVAPETSSPPSPLPNSAVIVPSQTQADQTRPSFTAAVRQMFGQEELASTKLRVIVQQYPDGPGLYGLQVRVTCKGIKSHVAGTTDREGKFICELPVRIHSGLTYDIDVTWPREEGGDVERKSITLNADRTHFVIPFYRKLQAPDNA